MNRTYWALALGCNVVVLDSVYHALAQFLFESSAAYRLWKIVRIIDALTQKAGQLQETRIRVPRKSAATTAMLNVQNHQNVYLDWDSIVWSFPGDAAQLVLNYYNKTKSRLVLHWREHYDV